jgi:hypothetical protein
MSLGAARRFGFRRKSNVHPVSSLEDANVAVAALGMAFLELAGLPSAQQHDALKSGLRRHRDTSDADAAEAMILGRWLMSQCGGAEPAVERISCKLRKLGWPEVQPSLMAVLNDVIMAGSGKLQTRQSEALETIAHIFKIS